MISPSAVNEYIASLNNRTDFTQGDDAQSPAALPDASLTFLTDLCLKLGIKHVFEFGSGRSTKALLGIGCSVVSLEDSSYWMEQTVKTLTVSEKKNHTALVKPLSRIFIGLFPVSDWRMDDELASYLKKAELVLIDSPYYVPFRESTLWSGLTKNKGGIIILDDGRIPTVQKFCHRIAAANPSLTHVRVPVGHVFDVFFNVPGSQLRLNHSLIDSVKGWRRYFLGSRLYRKLKNNSENQ